MGNKRNAGDQAQGGQVDQVQGDQGGDQAQAAATETQDAASQAAEEKPAAAAVARDPAAHAGAVRRVMAAFGAALPGDANSSGYYLAPEDSQINPDIRDGKFRVIGSDWAGRFEGGRMVEAFRCVPPHFGGDDIEIIN